LAYWTNYLNKIPTEWGICNCSSKWRQLDFDLGYGHVKLRRRSWNSQLIDVYSPRPIRNKINRFPSSLLRNDYQQCIRWSKLVQAFIRNAWRRGRYEIRLKKTCDSLIIVGLIFIKNEQKIWLMNIYCDFIAINQ
jgi:hypothetical protein